MRRLLKDRAAEADLVNIWLYTFEQWNERQADRYLAALERGVTAILQRPNGGRPRETLRTGYWSRRVEHHVVFYTFSDTEVRVRRVLHESMDPDRHLDDA